MKIKSLKKKKSLCCNFFRYSRRSRLASSHSPTPPTRDTNNISEPSLLRLAGDITEAAGANNGNSPSSGSNQPANMGSNNNFNSSCPSSSGASATGGGNRSEDGGSSFPDPPYSDNQSLYGRLSTDRLRFHDKCGLLVKLSNSGRTAERRRPLDEFNNGVVMSNRALRENELFEVIHFA